MEYLFYKVLNFLLSSVFRVKFQNAASLEILYVPQQFSNIYGNMIHLNIVQKGGQVTKPIIVVKMPCKLLYVIQVKGFIKCSTWPYLISEVLVAYNHCGF